MVEATASCYQGVRYRSGEGRIGGLASIMCAIPRHSMEPIRCVCMFKSC